MEKSVSRLARLPNRRRRMQWQLCKRCAASARQRNCRSSFLRAENLLNQSFKPRMAAEWVKEGIYFDKRDVGTGAIAVGALSQSIALSFSPSAMCTRAKL